MSAVVACRRAALGDEEVHPRARRSRCRPHKAEPDVVQHLEHGQPALPAPSPASFLGSSQDRAPSFLVNPRRAPDHRQSQTGLLVHAERRLSLDELVANIFKIKG